MATSKKGDNALRTASPGTKLRRATLDRRRASRVRGQGPVDHLVVTAGPALGSRGSFMDPDMRGVRGYLEGKFLGTWACARAMPPRTCGPAAR